MTMTPRRPELKVILTTGYDDDPVVTESVIRRSLLNRRPFLTVAGAFQALPARRACQSVRHHSRRGKIRQAVTTTNDREFVGQLVPVSNSPQPISDKFRALERFWGGAPLLMAPPLRLSRKLGGVLGRLLLRTLRLVWFVICPQTVGILSVTIFLSSNQIDLTHNPWLCCAGRSLTHGNPTSPTFPVSN